MPWRGPAYAGEFPTLGYLVADYIEARCAIPDGPHVGDSFVLPDWQLELLIWHYRLDPKARPDVDKPSRAFVYRGSQCVEPQKKGKGPLSAAIICAEADGPVIFDGWDAHGEPVGRPWLTPWIQVTAVSEDQTDNVWRALLPMIDLGDFGADIGNTGETRINLRGGGRIEPVTASARSRLGQRITFAVQDETHSWNKLNGGRALADNQRRNLAGMGGRWLETTNAWDPSEGSVAQQTYESPVKDIHRAYRPPPAGSVRNKRERRKVLRFSYAGSPWVDLDRIDAEIEELLGRDPSQAERYFLNRLVAAEDQAFDTDRWDQNASDFVAARGALIVIGVDGARFDDALAMVATDVVTGHQWPLGIWEVPAGAPDNYEHPDHEIDGVMVEAFERFEPWRVYVDPQYIENLLERWQGRWGDKRVVPWYTNRPRQIAYAVRRYATSIGAGDFTHDGDPTMARHVGNARKYSLNVFDDDRRRMWSISKDRPGSKRKIDGAMAGIISWEARGDAIAAGALAPKRDRVLHTF